jgi:hypothetical protein
MTDSSNLFWFILLPLALLVAVRQIPQQRWVLPVVAAVLALQVLVSNAFLRPVGTGLTDPPIPPSAVAMTEKPAVIWQDGPVLVDVTMPATAVTGQTITVETIWNGRQPSDQSYTLFLHLVDENKTLVAQFDGLPRGGEWPTTCWQPGQTFADAYSLAIPENALPGICRLQMGFYTWPSLERLPLTQPTGRQNNNADVGTIQLTNSVDQDFRHE